MKKLERLWVKVTYEVDLSDVEVPDEVYEELEHYGWSGIGAHNTNTQKAFSWLSDNINESSALDWEYEIEDLITEEE